MSDDALAIVLDGRLVTKDAARVSVLDRGFLYGDSVSETTRARAGVPFALPRHLERLRASCEELALAAPTFESLTLAATLALSSLGREHAALRFQITRGAGGLGLDAYASVSAPTVLVTAREIEPMKAHGSISVECTGTPFSAPFSAKIASYASTIRARAAARAHGRDDVIFVNREGHAIEGGSSNVLAIVAGAVRAPSEGALAGITREVVLSLARARGMQVDEGRLSLVELLAADDAFLLSSLRGMVRIASVDDTALTLRGTQGDALRDAYLAHFERETRPR